ncbi:DegT/DnrJ/EryC1/StrS family aminotransferase [Peribacillus sp. NJ11]|uniref:DegT/DnrJ/EryC1/StrS family aminotransferase n=1 Tax=Peribacillus sp. NJ11 TaxID=3055861 RepID=UPI0025A0FB42|nr:DegT/DnrJ/EryC1/StrS family aminotransferase [Peribacillus sp. NJ11]MDM5224450.1 DegT/DnrJ/EryC1/StrS family aminotransferase [Peribacillus sp. NJ11]
MKIQFFNLQKINLEIEDEINQAVQTVIHRGEFILGQAVKKFEEELACYLVGYDQGYVTGCNSGTDALILSLLAAGISAGDEVITVSHTAIPTVAAICAIGAKPVFVDIDPETWVMDISKVAYSITTQTKAIVPVHLYGNMVNIYELKSLLRDIKREEIIIVEDVAQAHGSRLNGIHAGTIGDYGAFSFYPTKNIGALGDSGAVFCRSEDNASRLKILRNYGQKDRYHLQLNHGINSRLDEIQAEILNIKLTYLDKWNERRSRIMDIYRTEFADLPLFFQKRCVGCKAAWHLCVIALQDRLTRDKLFEYLRSNGIGTLIHYPVPVHKQTTFSSNPVKQLSVTEDVADRILSLPMNPALTYKEQEYVIKTVRLFFTSLKINKL